MIGTVTGVTRAASCTELELATAEGTTSMRIAALADHTSAARVVRSMRRCLSLQVDCTPAGWTWLVRGIGHRRPVDLRISTATALGLIERGLPTVVRLP